MIPDVIFKYEECSLQSIRNLKNQVIYFGAPSNFNDPYDCALDPKIRAPKDQDIADLKRALLLEDDLPAEIRQDLEKIEDDSFREIILARSQEVLRTHAQEFLSRRGVACFSEVNDNLLMWSHYSGSYQGFCLGFRTDFDPFRKIQRVSYSEQMPEIDVALAMMKNEFSQMLDLFLTKSKHWGYEREWRCMHERAGTEFCYVPGALEGVYFGPEIAQDCLEIICLIVQGQNNQVRFWKGERDPREFKVSFREFTYTRAIDAPSQP